MLKFKNKVERGEVILLCSRKIFLVLILILVGVFAVGRVWALQPTCSDKNCISSPFTGQPMPIGVIDANGQCSLGNPNSNSCQTCQKCQSNTDIIKNGGHAIGQAMKDALADSSLPGYGSLNNKAANCDPDSIKKYLVYAAYVISSQQLKTLDPSGQIPATLAGIENCFSNNKIKISDYPDLYIQAKFLHALYLESFAASNKVIDTGNCDDQNIYYQETYTDIYYDTEIKELKSLESDVNNYQSSMDLCSIIQAEARVYYQWANSRNKALSTAKILQACGSKANCDEL